MCFKGINLDKEIGKRVTDDKKLSALCTGVIQNVTYIFI